MNKSNSKSLSANTSSSITSTSANSGLSSNLSSSTIGYSYSSTISSSPIYGYDGGINYGDSLWEYTIDKLNLSDDTINKIIKKILDSDDDLLPLVKNYLIKYLDQVMDNPEEIIKDLIKEKDTEISRLREELDSLTKRLEKLEKESLGGIKLREVDTESPGEWTTTNWIYDHSTTTSDLGTATYYSQSSINAKDMNQITKDRLQKKICEGLEKLSASNNTTSRNDPNPY